MDAARLTLGFVFDTLGVHRLEARAAIKNARGTGALAKIGAIKEGLLRKSFYKDGEYPGSEPVVDPPRGLGGQGSVGREGKDSLVRAATGHKRTKRRLGVPSETNDRRIET